MDKCTLDGPMRVDILFAFGSGDTLLAGAWPVLDVMGV